MANFLNTIWAVSKNVFASQEVSQQKTTPKS